MREMVLVVRVWVIVCCWGLLSFLFMSVSDLGLVKSVGVFLKSMFWSGF